MNYQTLEVSHEGAVLRIFLNRPDVRNAFNDEVIAELTRVFEREATAGEIRAVVLQGRGKVFCAGGDLNWMKKSVEWSREENLQDTLRLSSLFRKMNEFPKPLIAAVHGAAIGGGVGLVGVCDVALATEDTVFSLSEVRLGLIPACIGPFVIAKIGAAQARRYFVCGERFPAARAKEIGLVHELAATTDELHAKLESLLNNLLLCGPSSVEAAKRLVLDLSWPEKRNEIKDPYEHVSKNLAELRVSEEGQEGVRAFLEKRKPRWLAPK